MNLLIAYGTRPEYIKVKPIIDILKEKGDIPFKVLFTGQHDRKIMNFEYDWYVEIDGGLNRLDNIIQSLMNKIPIYTQYDNITHVLVQGDTTSAIAIALSAFNNGLKVIHLEAGLRTHDRENPYPEEINRRIISQIADVHLCPTQDNANNLIYERIININDIYLVGNTGLDGLLKYKDKCEYSNKILVTLHRRENHHWMDQWFIEIEKLAIRYPQYEFILPIHPNPNVQKHKDILKHITVVQPMDHDELIELLIKCRLVITDSGGLQEESSFFKKKCLTCRIITERPEAVGKSSFMVSSPNNLPYIFDLHHDQYKINWDCPFGDGHSSEIIYEIFKDLK